MSDTRHMLAPALFRTGPDLAGREVRDHDAAGLRLPPVVVHRQAQHVLTPHDGLRVEGLAHGGDEAQGGEVVRARQVVGALAWCGAHQHPQGRRGGVPDADPLPAEDPVPAPCVVVTLVGDHRHTVHERGEDAVRHAGDPSGVGGAPVHVPGTQVECVGGRGVVGDDRLVDVDRAFRSAGGAAGEVQEGHVVGGRRRDGEGVRRGGHQVVEGGGAGQVRRARSDDEDVFQVRERRAAPGDLAPVEVRSGDQDPRVTEAQPLLDRVGAEGREQRAQDAGALQRAQHRGVQLRAAPEQREHPVPAADAEGPQDVREAGRATRQFGVRDGGDGVVPGHADQRRPAGPGAGRVPVHRLVGHVEAAPGKPGQFRTRLRPGEGRAGRFVVGETWRDHGAGVLGDGFPVHRCSSRHCPGLQGRRARW